MLSVELVVGNVVVVDGVVINVPSGKHVVEFVFSDKKWFFSCSDAIAADL